MRLLTIAATVLFGCAGPAQWGADEIVDAPGASGTGFGDPELAINGVRGGGARMQSLDVYSIGTGWWLIVGFSGQRFEDGPGDDLVVFENPFEFGDEALGLTFMDPTIVEVSDDRLSWTALAHDYTAPDETMYSPRREHWQGFAGVEPVYLNAESNPVDAFGADAGGDRFDLADSGVDGFRFVRLSAASDHDNPDTGEHYVRDLASDGPDIDGVFARYPGAP